MQNQARTVPSLSPEDFLLRRRPPILLDFPRRLAREKPLGFAGAVIVIVFALAALFAPLVAPFVSRTGLPLAHALSARRPRTSSGRTTSAATCSPG